MGPGGVAAVVAVAVIAWVTVLPGTASACVCGAFGLAGGDDLPDPLPSQAAAGQDTTQGGSAIQGGPEPAPPKRAGTGAGPPEPSIPEGDVVDTDAVNETLAAAADTVLDAYGDVVSHWPKSTPGGGVEVFGMAGSQPLPRLPNPGNPFEPRSQPSEKPPAPPSEDTVRDAVEKMAGARNASVEEPGSAGKGPTTGARGNEQSITPQLPEGVPLPVQGREGAPQPASPPSRDEPAPPPLAALTTTQASPDELPPAALVLLAAVGISLVSVVAWILSQTRTMARLAASWPAAALFSRQTGSKVLQHPARARIHAAVAQDPGITTATLVQVTGLPLSSLRHHVGVLRRENLIRVTHRGRIHHYHDASGRVNEQTRARECLFWRRRSWLASAILEHPGASQQTVARLAGLPASRVCAYSRELEGAGLIRSERADRCRRYFPTRLLETLHSSGQLPSGQ